MEIIFTPQAEADFNYWLKTGNQPILKRIRKLLEDIETDPFTGIGKPEALKHNLAGCWSRRITQEHRLVYKVDGNVITVVTILSMRFHY